MTNNSKNLGLAILTISMLMSLAVSSCADKDFDWEAARMQSPIYKYMKNFEESFGEIDPEMSWDFTEYANSAASTRAAGDPVTYTTASEWFEVPTAISDYISEAYPEQENKTNFEKAVSFRVPNDGKFTIYPVYQGLALLWDVYIKIGDSAPTKIWQKSQDIERKINLGGDKWVKLQEYNSSNFNGNNYIDYNNGSYENIWWLDGYNESNYDNKWVFGSGDSKGGKTTTLKNYSWGGNDFQSTKQVRVKPISFDIPKRAGEAIEIYLLITGVGTGYFNAFPGDIQSSTTAQCKVMHLETPTSGNVETLRKNALTAIANNNAFKDQTVTMIGFEDGRFYKKPNDGDYLHDGVNGERISVENNQGNKINVKAGDNVNLKGGKSVKFQNTDWDYNDLVLMVVASEFKENEYYKDEKTVEKRYMVEDLGAVDNSDIDFNDIVVDFKQTYRDEGDKVYSTSTSYEKVSHKGFPRITQEAKIYALGGTLDLTLYVGDPTKAESTWTKIFTKSTAGADDILNPNYHGELASLDYKIMYNTNMSKGGDGYYNPDDYIASVTMTTIQGTDNIDRTNMVAKAKNVWRPDLNNLIVKVVNPKGNTQSSKDYDQDITDGTTLITFPEKGRIPKIIAVPTTQEWNNERISVFTHDRNGSRLNLRKVFEQSTGQTTEK